jgi:hypothetical protein
MRAALVAALIGLAAALTAPSAANAAACWQRVLDDWRDGRLDAVYPVQCYREALTNMPEDLRVYGTAETDIQNALSRELARSAAVKPRPAADRTTSRVTTVTRARTPSQRRTLAGRSATQPKLRLAAASDAGARERFPLAPVVAGAAVLAAGLVALTLLRRRLPR